MTNGELADRYLHRQKLLGLKDLNLKVYSDYDVILHNVDREARSIVIPSFVTEIFAGVFEKATFNKLTINVRLQTMDNLFYKYAGDELSIEIAEPDSITSLHNCFKDVKSLISVDMSSITFKNVKSISKMFSGCTNITSIKMPNLSLSNVNEVYGAFEMCWKLKLIDGFDIDTSKIKSFDHMFFCCGSLQNLDSIEIDMSKATSAIYAFSRSSAGLSTLARTPLANIRDTRRIFNHCDNISLSDLIELGLDIPVEKLRKMV